MAKVGLVVDGGRISKRLMMEQIALHIPEDAAQRSQATRTVDIRCGVADFVVEDGVMQAKDAGARPTWSRSAAVEAPTSRLKR